MQMNRTVLLDDVYWSFKPWLTIAHLIMNTAVWSGVKCYEKYNLFLLTDINWPLLITFKTITNAEK